MPAELVIKKSSAFYPMFAGINRRYLILTGGRASGKSFIVSLWACWKTTDHQHRQRILYTRYTLTSAEISIIPEFESKMDLLGIRPIFNVTRRVVTNLQTGNDIIFSGIKTSSGNQTAKLKSIPDLNIFIVDEAEEFEDEAAFDTIDESIRVRDSQNLIILILNPPTNEHWIWKRWFKDHHHMKQIDGFQIPICTHPDVIHIHTTYLDNLKNLSDSFLINAESLKRNNPAKYAHRLLGQWRAKAEGVIFENWEEGAFDESLPYAYGLDFGFWPDPTAMVMVAVDKRTRTIYAREMLYETKLSTPQIVNLMGLVRRDRDLIVADSAEPRLIADIGAAGYNITKAAKGPDSVRDGLRRMQAWRIVVSPDSYNLKTELNNYVWNDRKSDTPIDDYNHLIDAMRYVFDKLAGPADVMAFG